MSLARRTAVARARPPPPPPPPPPPSPPPSPPPHHHPTPHTHISTLHVQPSIMSCAAPRSPHVYTPLIISTRALHLPPVSPPCPPLPPPPSYPPPWLTRHTASSQDIPAPRVASCALLPERSSAASTSSSSSHLRASSQSMPTAAVKVEYRGAAAHMREWLVGYRGANRHRLFTAGLVYNDV